jgi:glycogen debranching enzyme
VGFVREMEGAARRALGWILDHADRGWEDQELAREIRVDAEALRERFDRDFWMEDRDYYALALNGAGRKVDSITSDPDHLLWSDIVPAKKARLVADGLMGEALSCGWGIRTMAAGEGGYDPGFHHNGSVWPHDKRPHRLRPPALRVSGGGKPGRRRAPRRRPVLRP